MREKVWGLREGDWNTYAVTKPRKDASSMKGRVFTHRKLQVRLCDAGWFTRMVSQIDGRWVTTEPRPVSDKRGHELFRLANTID